MKENFIGIWKANGEIWSATLRINENGELEKYNNKTDDWDNVEGTYKKLKEQMKLYGLAEEIFENKGKVEHYHSGGIQACDIMDMIKPPKELKGSQVHSMYNIIKRIRRFGMKDNVEKEAKKITEEFNHIITGKYR